MDEERTKMMGGREKIKKEIRRKSKRNRKNFFFYVPCILYNVNIPLPTNAPFI